MSIIYQSIPVIHLAMCLLCVFLLLGNNVTHVIKGTVTPLLSVDKDFFFHGWELKVLLDNIASLMKYLSVGLKRKFRHRLA